MAKKKERKLRKYRKVVFTAGFSLVMIAFLFLSVHFEIFDIFAKKLLDFRFRYFNQQNPITEEVVYLDIDETSLQTFSDQIGGWPWPRGSVVGELIIDYVMQGAPEMFLFDILYVDYSPKTPDVDIPDEDLILLDYCLLYPEVSHAVHFERMADGERKPLPETAAANFRIEVDDSRSTIDFPEFDTYVMPYFPLGDYAGNLHLVNHIEDSDGISRNYHFLYYYDGAYYPSLALRALIALLDVGSMRIEGRDFIMKPAEGPEITVPLLENGDFQLNYYADEVLNSMHQFPADNVIASAMNYRDGTGELLVDLDEFADKVVIIGASATGLKDLKVTPMGKNIAGPYLHVTAISNVLQDQFLKPVPEWLTVLIVALSIVFIVLTTTFVKNGLAKNILGIAYIIAFVAAALVLFRFYGLVFEIALTLVISLLSYFGALIFLSLTEGAEKNKISSAMGKYIAPAVMEEVLERYDELIGEVGEKKEIAVLFSDIRSFTTISESYEAETVVHLLNQYLSAMIDVVFEYRGTLDKMIGDAIMAFWGAPGQQQNKESLAVQAALAMIRKLPEVNALLAEQQLQQLRIGVGVNTGDMIVGNIGSEKRLDYTCIGDNVNLGSRLEGLTKYYKIPIIVSRSTYERTKDEFIYLFLDNVAVKGKETGVRIYAPVAEKTPDSIREHQDEITAFNEAHKLYLNRQFTEAGREFVRLSGELPNFADLAGVYAERSEYMLANPPGEGWDGMWKMVEK